MKRCIPHKFEEINTLNTKYTGYIIENAFHNQIVMIRNILNKLNIKFDETKLPGTGFITFVTDITDYDKWQEIKDILKRKAGIRIKKDILNKN